MDQAELGGETGDPEARETAAGAPVEAAGSCDDGAEFSQAAARAAMTETETREARAGGAAQEEDRAAETAAEGEERAAALRRAAAPPPPPLDRALLVEAVREAGPIALAYFRPSRASSARSWAKEDGSSVTEADLAVNRALKARLLSARPAYGWLSEEEAETEGAASRLSAERVFVVDPIDGTRAFMNGDPVFCLSVAVVDRGVPVAAAVYAPAMERLYDAAAGAGARMNEAPPPPRPPLGAPPRVLAPARDLQAKRWAGEGGPPELRRGYVQPIAHRLCLAAMGEWDGMLAVKRVHEWDIAAAHLIAGEAGLAVTDRAGAALRYNKAEPVLPGVFAAPPEVLADWVARRPIG